MSDDRTYATPAAFRRALTDRLREKANSSRWALADLQRYFAYDRLLERLYLVDEAWVVKGAVALLARDLGVRATTDIDVYREIAADVAEADLREAAALDLGDWFRFELGPRQPIGDAGSGTRVPVAAYVGATVWAEFHVDLVGSDLRMTGQPEEVPALARVAIPDVEQHGYRAYPLVDHIADKIAAILETHGVTAAPSTRFKDLVDLVAILIEAAPEAEPQIAALRSELARRGIAPPHRFEAPDRELWERGYGVEARRSLLPVAVTLEEALVVVRPFVDLILKGTALGVWDPARRRWSGVPRASGPAGSG